MEYEPVIGMEVHAELLTESKMFCGCKVAFGGEPNTRCCPVCIGLPGSLPVMNERAVHFVARTALALNCKISEHSIFHRKNYFYPDLPKGYQISQYGETPIGIGGYVEINVNGKTKRIGIKRVHLEEDTGKLFHVEGDKSQIDYNRSGVPLMEIVTEHDPAKGFDQINSAEEAREYLVRLRSIIIYLGVSDGKMEEGSMRCEPNISIRPKGSSEFGTRTEIKNLNSFKAVYGGVQYEVERQAKILNRGGTVVHETRRWDDSRGVTAVMRSKEMEQEYRYFPEPDLVPLQFDPAWIEEQRKLLPELPQEKKRRFVEQFGIPDADAEVLTDSKALAAFYETAVQDYHDPKVVANWVMGDFLRMLNAAGLDADQSKIAPEHIVEMLKLIDNGTISGKIAKTVFADMFETGKRPEEIVKEKGLVQITDESAIETAVDQVLKDNPAEVEKYRAGKQELMGFFVGQVMRSTRGKANPGTVNKLLKEKLA
ncbi:MAG: Asp-tRNA(Asn)/Glu-tRNA(Gln) amidotransferase subunit GatB [Armatimonadota bacterium]